MFIKLRPRSAYDVMAAPSRFSVVGGTSYAGARNSIGIAQINNNSIRSEDVRRNVISSAEISSSSLLAANFKDGQLPVAPRGQQGPSGAPSANAAIGLAGSQ